MTFLPKTRTSPSFFRHVRAGMTLVEIMVVIALIGILITVVLSAVWDRYQEGLQGATRLQISQIGQDLQLYALKHKGKFPTTSEGLAAAYKGKDVPLDAWGNEFQYFSPGTHGDHPYEIISLGADGKEGGEDVDADLQSWNLDNEEQDQ